MASTPAIIVIGSSTGGFSAVKKLLCALPAGFPVPLVVAQHLSAQSDNFMAVHIDGLAAITVKEADEKEVIRPSTAYIAPANYHLLVEENGSLTLSTEEKHNYARPSVDVLFESAALAYGRAVIGIILTGANNDGALGLKAIRDAGGRTLVQDPSDAEAPMMPEAALQLIKPDLVLPIDKMVEILLRWCPAG